MRIDVAVGEDKKSYFVKVSKLPALEQNGRGLIPTSAS